MRGKSLKGKKYIFFIVDDFCHFTWIFFPREKSEAIMEFSKF